MRLSCLLGNLKLSALQATSSYSGEQIEVIIAAGLFLPAKMGLQAQTSVQAGPRRRADATVKMKTGEGTRLCINSRLICMHVCKSVLF